MRIAGWRSLCNVERVGNISDGDDIRSVWYEQGARMGF